MRRICNSTGCSLGALFALPQLPRYTFRPLFPIPRRVSADPVTTASNHAAHARRRPTGCIPMDDGNAPGLPLLGLQVPSQGATDDAQAGAGVGAGARLPAATRAGLLWETSLPSGGCHAGSTSCQVLFSVLDV